MKHGPQPKVQNTNFAIDAFKKIFKVKSVEDFNKKIKEQKGVLTFTCKEAALLEAVESNDFSEMLRDAKVTSIKFFHEKISPKTLAALVNKLRDTPVTHLEFGVNYLDDKSIAALAEYLKNTNITSIKFSENAIDAKGAAALIKALQGTQVTHIDLSLNPLGDEGVKAIAKGLPSTNITSVKLARTKMGSLGVLTLAKYLPATQVTDVDISANQLSTDVLAAFVKKLRGTKVDSLNLSGSIADNSVSPSRLIAIAEALQGTNVINFILCNYNFEDNLRHDKLAIAKGLEDFAAALRKTNVKSLNFSSNRMFSSGAAALIKGLQGTKVSHLILCNNYLSSMQGFLKGLRLTNIVSLDLRSNVIGKEGLTNLARGIKGSCLMELNLGCNHISDEAAVVLLSYLPDTRVSLLKVNSEYDYLEGEWASISDSMKQRLEAIVQKNSTKIAHSVVQSPFWAALALKEAFPEHEEVIYHCLSYLPLMQGKTKNGERKVEAFLKTAVTAKPKTCLEDLKKLSEERRQRRQP